MRLANHASLGAARGRRTTTRAGLNYSEQPVRLLSPVTGSLVLGRPRSVQLMEERYAGSVAVDETPAAHRPELPGSEETGHS